MDLSPLRLPYPLLCNITRFLPYILFRVNVLAIEIFDTARAPWVR